MRRKFLFLKLIHNSMKASRDWKAMRIRTRKSLLESTSMIIETTYELLLSCIFARFDQVTCSEPPLHPSILPVNKPSHVNEVDIFHTQDGISTVNYLSLDEKTTSKFSISYDITISSKPKKRNKYEGKSISFKEISWQQHLIQIYPLKWYILLLHPLENKICVLRTKSFLIKFLP